MANKQISQLKQFKIFSYEDWVKNSESYIPSLGEICGIIVHNTDERSLFPIPDGYENVTPPFTLLKMGDGNTPVGSLSWVTATESEVVINILNQLLEGKEVEGGEIPLLSIIRDYVIENSADWLQNDSSSASYIKNKICYLNYEVIEEKFIIQNKTLTKPYSNDTYYTFEFNQNDLLIDADLLQPYYLYSFDFVKSKEEIIKLNKQILKKKDIDNNSILYFGNLSLADEHLENTQEKYLILFQFKNYISDSEGLIYDILCIFPQQYCVLDPNLNTVSIDITTKLTHQTSSITPIDPMWLPEEVKASSDWMATGEENGYILNKICQVDSYKYSGTVINNDITFLFENPYYGIANIPYNEFNTNFSKMNYYSIYIDNELINESRPINYDILNSGKLTYIFGNFYLYLNLYASIFKDIGQPIPANIQNLMLTYPDNNQNIVLVLIENTSTQSWEAQIINRWNQLSNIKSQEYIYNSPIEYQVRNLKTLICANNQLEDLNRYKEGYVLNDNKLNKILSFNYDENSNITILELEEELINYKTLDKFKPVFYHPNSKQKITLNLSREPDVISTIDPMWLPDNALVGAYGENGKAQGAEIYNDLSNNRAFGLFAHAEGQNTIASGDIQHVQGKFNLEDKNKAFIIGNGNDNNNRSNAYTLDWQGNSSQQGKVYATDFINSSGESLTSKESMNNKVTNFNIDTMNNNEYPTTQAVYSFLQNLFNLSINQQGQIIFNIETIDGNTFYGKDEEFTRVDGNDLWDKPFIDIN